MLLTNFVKAQTNYMRTFLQLLAIYLHITILFNEAVSSNGEGVERFVPIYDTVTAFIWID
jgi:hypothetical protein